SFLYVLILKHLTRLVKKFANFLAKIIKGGTAMGFGSMTVTVKIANIDRFIELSNEFNKKARELEQLTHELKTFDFEGEVVSTDSN
ncbi:TPA: hypothetical protein ACIRGN_002324, partial [Streptococcus suis]